MEEDGSREGAVRNDVWGDTLEKAFGHATDDAVAEAEHRAERALRIVEVREHHAAETALGMSLAKRYTQTEYR